MSSKSTLNPNPQPPAPRGAAYLSSLRFHQSFTLPVNPSHGRSAPLRVSYCDLDYREQRPRNASEPKTNDTEGPTLLFLPGAGERRYYGALWADELARRHKVRYVHPDRFGVGGTGEVGLKWRVESFVDLVEELLKHLGIKHVALACHSAGAIYTFNTILRLRHILHPRKPFVCFMTPWVLPRHSRTFVSSAACLIPSSILSQSHLIDQKIPLKAKWLLYGAYTSVEHFFSKFKHLGESSRLRRFGERLSHRKDQPLEKRLSEDESSSDASSQTTLGAEVDAFTFSVRNPDEEYDNKEDDEHDCYGECCVDTAFYLDCMFAENSTGVADDLLLCLKRKGVKKWGLFADYPEAMELLRSQELKLLTTNGADEKKSKLRVETIFAEEDSLIGDRGALWFNSLWKGQEDWAGYCGVVKEGFGHDEIPSQSSGCMDWIMKEVAEVWRHEETGPKLQNKGPQTSWNKGW